jgi:hypothetical protein
MDYEFIEKFSMLCFSETLSGSGLDWCCVCTLVEYGPLPIACFRKLSWLMALDFVRFDCGMLW